MSRYACSEHFSTPQRLGESLALQVFGWRANLLVSRSADRSYEARLSRCVKHRFM